MILLYIIYTHICTRVLGPPQEGHKINQDALINMEVQCFKKRTKTRTTPYKNDASKPQTYHTAPKKYRTVRKPYHRQAIPKQKRRHDHRQAILKTYPAGRTTTTKLMQQHTHGRRTRGGATQRRSTKHSASGIPPPPPPRSSNRLDGSEETGYPPRLA